MHTVALLVVGLAAALHVGIFAMESVLWTRPQVWRLFGLRSQADAETTRAFAYNQGFYNLFLATVGALGVGFDLAGNPAGFVLMLVAVASMLGAAIVLVTTGPGYLRAAVIQGTFPTLGLVLLLVG